MGTVDAGDVLFGATRRKLLGWLYAHADRSFYFRELLRETNAPEGAAQRELALLTAAALITRERRGNLVFYRANEASPIFPELKSLLAKTTRPTAPRRLERPLSRDSGSPELL